jgi:hypothetical protein
MVENIKMDFKQLVFEGVKWFQMLRIRSSGLRL